MPLMPEMRSSVVFLYKNSNDAAKDNGFLAMGFLLSKPSLKVKPLHHVYLVTNEHVVRGKKEICVRINKVAGGFSTVILSITEFVFDKKFDIAISPFPMDSEMEYLFTFENDLLEDWRNDQTKLPIGPGDDVVMISRIVGLKTKYKTKNLPVLRFGNVALCPAYEEEFFITEMRSVAGHSGSPVWVYNLPWFSGLRPEHKDFGFKLLGINRGHLPNYEEVIPVEDILAGRESRKNPTHYVATNMSMSQVVPAWKITELLNCDELLQAYQESEDALDSEVSEDTQRKP